MLPSYLLVLLLIVISDEKYVNTGWDSGGVTSGDITSPILIALGLVRPRIREEQPEWLQRRKKAIRRMVKETKNAVLLR